MDKLFAILIFEGEGDNQRFVMDRGKIATFKSLKDADAEAEMIDGNGEHKARVISLEPVHE